MHRYQGLELQHIFLQDTVQPITLSDIDELLYYGYCSIYIHYLFILLLMSFNYLYFMNSAREVTYPSSHS